MENSDFNRLLQLILQKVVIIPNEVLSLYKKEAFEITKKIDIDDAVFIACALTYPKSIIWSNDKKLKMQDKIKILNTAEIINVI